MGEWEPGNASTPSDHGGEPAEPRPETVDWSDPATRRAAVCRAIAALELPDAVLAILLIEERYPAPEGAPRLALTELLPAPDASNLIAWLRAARELMRAADDYGRRHVRGAEPGPALVAAMAAQHPGFSMRSYGDVLFLGVSRQL